MGVFGWVNRQFLGQLPIRVLDRGNPEQKRQHDGIVALVEEMLRLPERLMPLRSEAQRGAGAAGGPGGPGNRRGGVRALRPHGPGTATGGGGLIKRSMGAFS